MEMLRDAGDFITEGGWVFIGLDLALVAFVAVVAWGVLACPHCWRDAEGRRAWRRAWYALTCEERW